MTFNFAGTMPTQIEAQFLQFEEMAALHPWTAALIALALLVLIAALANWLAKKIVVRLITQLIEHTPLREESEYFEKLVSHLSNVVPAVIIGLGITTVPNIPDRLVSVSQNVAWAFIIFSLARVLSDFLSLANHSYEHRDDAAMRPIKGYIQVAKIVIYAAAAILMVAQLIGQSPLLLLSGLGAMAAVLMLIFRDTILSLVASVQLRSNDMLRVGDWIEVPELNADGDVVDIALHVVKVQNFDKTVTYIPTHRLISDSFRNWRGMREWGGRRIKRSIHIDQGTIGFMTDEQWQEARRFRLLKPYMESKEAELAEWNARLAPDDGEPVNRRRPTNFGTFRAYVIAYLQHNPHVTDRGTLLVRHREPSDVGLPLEIYCFADTAVWLDYEAIQADIFDHLLSILPEFGLRAFQQPSGGDVKAVSSGVASAV